MAFLSSLKRLFFTTESIAKSAVDNAVDYSKEKAGDIADAAKVTLSDFSDKTAGLRESVIEKANVAYDKVEAVAETAWDKTKEVAVEVKEAANVAFDKAGEVAEEATEKIKDVAHKVEVAAESAWDKATDKTSDAKEDIADSAAHSSSIINESNLEISELVEPTHIKTEDKAGADAESLLDKTKNLAGNFADKLSENELIQKAGAMAENLGGKVMATGAVVVERASEMSENVGAKVLDASDKTWDKISEAKDILSEKAKEVADNIGKKFDETVDKAEKFLAEEDTKPKKEFADETLTTGGSLMEGKDDFFAKASQYADGDYDAFSEGKITVTNPNPSEFKNPAKSAGQEDHDGDGNEQIDDAIIVE
jgi:DNA-directed RNA polymerase subunit F